MNSSDLLQFDNLLQKRFKNFATKEDVKQLDTNFTKRLDQRFLSFAMEIIEKVEESKMEIIELVDKHKADKENLKTLEQRVDGIQKALEIPSSQ